MGKVFESSRLSQGNKIFPTTVEIDQFGVTVKIPGLFSGKSETISFDQISLVKVDTPLVGFSSITFDTTGWGRVTGTGFTKEQVTEMKELVQQGKSNRGYTGLNQSSVSQSQPQPVYQESETVQLRKLELERERELELQQRNDEFIGGVKSHFKKYWKIWVGVLVLLICISVYKDYSKKKSMDDFNKQWDEKHRK